MGRGVIVHDAVLTQTQKHQGGGGGDGGGAAAEIRSLIIFSSCVLDVVLKGWL